MIVSNLDEKFILLNKSAEKMNRIHKSEGMGKSMTQIISSSLVPCVLRARRVENNQELLLDNGLKMISPRIPLKVKVYDGDGIHVVSH
jgi:signal transduction histidine kinase